MKVIVEYVWLGGENELRSKTRVLDHDDPICNPITIGDIPDWDYDGSSTKQAEGKFSEVILKPGAIFRDPFRGEYDIMVMCSTYRPDGTPLPNNHRHNAVCSFDKNPHHHPWFGLEQEYFLMDSASNLPLGYPTTHRVQGQYYCSVGANNAFGREMTEEHLHCCIKAGITISGVNAEVAPGQWEYQVGPCEGIDSGDHLWMARYIIYVCLEPKPLVGDWNGSGCHTNYSTLAMREEGGLDEIYKAIKLLSTKHIEHIKVYGTGNEKRLTGKHETSSMHTFTSGVANRGASVRIGNRIVADGRGYFEDRRPSSNMDPYLVTSKIFDTTVNDVTANAVNANEVNANEVNANGAGASSMSLYA